MSNLKSSCTLLVSSCDKYKDIWSPYFSLLDIYWKDCPFSKVLITEDEICVHPMVKSLRLGVGYDWSTLLLKALDQIDSKYIFFSLEDFFLRKKVDTTLILDALQFTIDNDLSMLRLIPRPGPDKPIVNGLGYGLINDSARYKVSTQAAIWRVDILRGLLRSGETIWEFEHNGSTRAAYIQGFVSVMNPYFPYGHHVIERGQWFPWEVVRCWINGVNIDLSARKVMPVHKVIFWWIKLNLSILKIKIKKFW